ncbi:unnamed protein product, partial [Ectocarpus fasciculatus]
EEIKPIAVNYHFTRKCNFSCGFCFHTAKNSHVESLDNAKMIIRSLREAGAEKINFAGGEPFLPDYRRILGEMVKYAKIDCGYESVSIISNGYYIKREFFDQYSEYLDILGVSCDSQDTAVNIKIGRGKVGQTGSQKERVLNAAALCKEFNVKFKLNTVVNSFNKHENMSALINEANPMRWKIFQVLPLEGENTGEKAINDVSRFLITNEEFEDYVQRHRGHVRDSIIKVENNDTMQASYVLVDEYGRFLDSSTGGKVPTKSILEVGVHAALNELRASEGGGYDPQAFERRDGAFRSEWSKNS